MVDLEARPQPTPDETTERFRQHAAWLRDIAQRLATLPLPWANGTNPQEGSLDLCRLAESWDERATRRAGLATPAASPNEIPSD